MVAQASVFGKANRLMDDFFLKLVVFLLLPHLEPRLHPLMNQYQYLQACDELEPNPLISNPVQIKLQPKANPVKKVLAQNYRTRDICESGMREIGTVEMGNAIFSNQCVYDISPPSLSTTS